MIEKPDAKVSAGSLHQWAPKSSTGNHFEVLDGIRGVAILLVVASHALYTNPAHGPIARAIGYIVQAGWMGVPIFFVLSGFLISLPIFKGRDRDPSFWYPPGYARRRLGKILPPFYLSIVVFLGFYWWQHHDPAYFTAAWKWATGLANFQAVPVPFNLSYWSLIVEVHFYALLPILFALTRGISVRRTTVILFATLFLVPLVARHLVWPPGVDVLPPYDSELHKDVMLKLSRFPAQLDYFAWGVAFAGIYVQLPHDREHLQPLSLLGYGGITLMFVTMLLWGYWSELFGFRAQPTRFSTEIGHLLPGAAAVLMLFFLFAPACTGARILSARWLRFIGLVSYEWFLFHGPVVEWFHRNYGPSNGSIFAYVLRTIAPLALSFVAAVGIYRWFSLPILNLLRGGSKAES